MILQHSLLLQVLVPFLGSVNMLSKSLYATAEDQCILAQGARHLCLLSVDGRVKATAPLSDIPIAQPVVGDFNNDGIMDVIITTPSGYFGFAIERPVDIGISIFSGFVGIVVVILVAIVMIDSFDFEQDLNSATKASGRRRSTDD